MTQTLLHAGFLLWAITRPAYDNDGRFVGLTAVVLRWQGTTWLLGLRAT